MAGFEAGYEPPPRAPSVAKRTPEPLLAAWLTPPGSQERAVAEYYPYYVEYYCSVQGRLCFQAQRLRRPCMPYMACAVDQHAVPSLRDCEADHPRT